MAHVELLRNNERANELRTAAKSHRTALDTLKSAAKAHIGIMTQMLTGVTSDIASFAGVASYYDIPGTDATARNTAAQLLFNETAAASADNASLAALVQFAAIVG